MKLEKRDIRKWIILCAVALLAVATVVAFAVAGKSTGGGKKAKAKKNETTVSETTTKPTTTEPTTVDARGSTDSVKMLIALCFDDGPGTDSTKKLVTGLKKRGARATFFELGQMIKENPEMCKLVSESGCEIGIHGYDHTTFTSLGIEGTKKHVNDTAQLIKQTTGKTPTHVRPPEGAYNDEIQKTLMDMGYDLIMWNVDTRDWSTRDADAVYQKIISDACDGGDILCLHDIYGTTADGVLRAVDELQAKGFKFVTISELQAARDKFVAGRIWLSAHEFYDYGSKENVAKQSLTTQVATSTDANGNTVTVTGSAGGSTDVAITWPDDAKASNGG